MRKYQRQEKAMGLVYSNFQDGAYFYNKGIEAYREKDLKKAKRYLERAVTLKPLEAAFNCQLAIIHADLGDYHQSNEYLKTIVDDQLDHDMAECHYFLANNYANLGLFEHARKQALLYIDKDPDGVFLEDVEDLLELLQDEDDLFAEAENFLIRYEVASQELRKGNYKKAINFFTEIIKEEPDYWVAHIRLSEAYFQDGETNKAITILIELLQEEDCITARAQLMMYYYEIGEKQQASQLLATLKNVTSMDHEQCHSLAVNFGKVGEHELAYEQLIKLKRRGCGDFTMFTYHLAVASFYTGRLEKAAAKFESLAELGCEVAAECLQLLKQGELHEPTYTYNQNFSEW